MNNLSFFKWMLSMSLCLMLYSCSNIKENTLHNPEIKDGIAKVTGKIINYPEESIPLPYLSILVPYPVTAEMKTYTTQMEADGSFSFEIPLECDVITSISLDDFMLGICLIPDKETKIELTYGREGVKVNTDNRLGLTNADMENLNPAVINHIVGEIQWDIYNLPPEEFNKRSIEKLDSLQQYIEQLPLLSNNTKNVLSHIFKLFMIKPLLNYTVTLNQQGNGNLDPSYYSFFQSFNLNDPLYLYGLYHEVTEMILYNDIFAIPVINNIPIEEWLKVVKANIAGIMGFDTGLFYDLLVANAYAKQLSDETKPLSETQKENIKQYFKNQSFVNILLNKNEEIVKIVDIPSYLKVNKTPSVSKEELTAVQNNKQPQGKLIDSVVSSYKGKVVVIDLWATWCGPCLQAMEKSKELKQELLDKDVIFVYLTNRSSPKNLWEKKIRGIGGEHYYLNGEEWESISFSDKYGFDGIPTYLIFDSNGELQHKITGYPGNDEMQKLIKELL